MGRRSPRPRVRDEVCCVLGVPLGHGFLSLRLHFVDEDYGVTGKWSLGRIYPDQDWSEAQIEFFRNPYQISVMAIHGTYGRSVLKEVGPPRPQTFRRITSGLEAQVLARVVTSGRIWC